MKINKPPIMVPVKTLQLGDLVMFDGEEWEVHHLRDGFSVELYRNGTYYNIWEDIMIQKL